MQSSKRSEQFLEETREKYSIVQMLGQVLGDLYMRRLPLTKIWGTRPIPPVYMLILICPFWQQFGENWYNLGPNLYQPPPP